MHYKNILEKIKNLEINYPDLRRDKLNRMLGYIEANYDLGLINTKEKTELHKEVLKKIYSENI